MSEDLCAVETDREQISNGSSWQVIRSPQVSEKRTLLADALPCPEFQPLGIAHAGLMEAHSPFEVFRTDTSGTFILASLDGHGHVHVEGQWREVSPSQLCFLSAFSDTGIRAVGGMAWRFVWIRYHESRKTAPILSADSPVIQSCAVNGFEHAFSGLYEELNQAAPSPVLLHLWTTILHRRVQQFAQPYADGDRLWTLWQRVGEAPGESWDLARLSQVAGMQPEQLRRETKRTLGMSPLQQVTHIRMRLATELLVQTGQTIEAISGQVGYENAFTFSNAFKRTTGRRPSDYRRV